MNGLAALAVALAEIHRPGRTPQFLGDCDQLHPKAASVWIRLSWRRGYPSVRVVRRCPATASC